jgi:hypothetical protein
VLHINNQIIFVYVLIISQQKEQTTNKQLNHFMPDIEYLPKNEKHKQGRCHDNNST